MLRNRKPLLSLVLSLVILALPLASTAAANTIRYTYQWTQSGWQLVATQTVVRTTYAYYRVQPGDSLSGISQRFRTTVTELQRINRLTGTTIHAGQLLLVPVSAQTSPQPVTQPTQPVPQPAPAPRPEAGLTQAEQQMLDLVNRERTSRGLPPLQADPELTRLARLKSQDMINLNYFAHQSPTYGSPFEMMRAAGVTYRTAGENLAGASGVERAHTALMNSSGHRANILNPGFTHIGIGIITGGSYGMMFTQLFVGR